jgi:hypothetical protein
LRTAWDTYQRTVGTPFEGLALGYLAGFVAMIAHCIGANTFIIVRIMEPFWFLTGAIAVLPLLQETGTGMRATGSQDDQSVRCAADGHTHA